MNYKSYIKIVIDKRKLDTIIRLGCPDSVLLSIIKTGKYTPTGDSLIDENLESLVDIKEFSNWGGKRENSGRKQKNNHLENQVENHLENQVANQDFFKSEININNKNKNNNNNNLNNNKFKKPSIEEITIYCKERKNTISAEQFYDFYESKGWKVGNTPMKDWKACIRTWEQKERERRTWKAAQGMFGVESGTYGKDIPL